MSKHLKKDVLAKLHALKNPGASNEAATGNPASTNVNHLSQGTSPARKVTLHQHRGSSGS